MPEGQEVCPECGCITYYKKKKSPKKVLVYGIVVFILALYNCLRVFTSTQNSYSLLPFILSLGIVTLINGILSIIRTRKNSLNIIGMCLALVAIICSVCVKTFYDNNYRKWTVEYREETIEMRQISVKFTFLCPTDFDYDDTGSGLDFFKKGTNGIDVKYAFSVKSRTFEEYKEYLSKYSKKCKKVEKINEYLCVYYFDDDFDFVALYDDETNLLIEMIFEERKYKDEIIKILTSMEIEKDPKIKIYSPRASLGLNRTKY